MPKNCKPIFFDIKQQLVSCSKFIPIRDYTNSLVNSRNTQKIKATNTKLSKITKDTTNALFKNKNFYNNHTNEKQSNQYLMKKKKYRVDDLQTNPIISHYNNNLPPCIYQNVIEPHECNSYPVKANTNYYNLENNSCPIENTLSSIKTSIQDKQKIEYINIIEANNSNDLLQNLNILTSLPNDPNTNSNAIITKINEIEMKISRLELSNSELKILLNNLVIKLLRKSAKSDKLLYKLLQTK